MGPEKCGQDNGISEQLAAASTSTFCRSEKTRGTSSRRVHSSQALLELSWEIYLTSTGLCIAIYSHSKTNQMHQFLKFIYFCITLYMFRTVFPSIIRSSELYTQQQAYVKLKLHRWVKLLVKVYVGCSEV
jgi:hypothetical protein